MASLSIIDSHIHLWPESMSNEEGHTWMTPGMPLAKAHMLSDYRRAAKQDERQLDTIVEGVIYVETDVRYDKPNGDIKSWAAGPLDEIKFLRSIVEGGYGDRASQLLKGIVAWAPMDQPAHVLEEWIRLVQETAGADTWKRIKGFRFLVQAIRDKAHFERLVSSEHFINNLKFLGKRQFAFDIGVDQNSGGIWQLELIAKAMKQAHIDVLEEEQVAFVINHLCKPDFTLDEAFPAWAEAVTAMAESNKTYMKLSGGFSELPEDLLASNDVTTIAEHIKPWVEHVFNTFGPERVIFGSDWPICNLRGPNAEDSWMTWKDVISSTLDHLIITRRLDETGKLFVWRDNVRRAYRLD